MKFLSILAFGLFMVVNTTIACPYSAMTEIDQKLQNSNYLDSQQLAEIKSLRKQGEAALRLGEVEKSEEILNMALAIFK
tara:strand:- start:21 stop:257 length:237 start_codon:yes stop_codon:yes gene_type:complete